MRGLNSEPQLNFLSQQTLNQSIHSQTFSLGQRQRNPWYEVGGTWVLRIKRSEVDKVIVSDQGRSTDGVHKRKVDSSVQAI